MNELLNILVGLFILALLAGLIWFIVWASTERAWGLLLVSGIIMLFILIAIVAAGVDAEKPTITLKKDAWTCTKTTAHETTTYVKNGAVLMPITSTTQVCIQYGKN